MVDVGLAELVVDERILSAVQVKATIEQLTAMRGRGLYASELAYHDLGDIVVTAGWEHEIDWDGEVTATLPANGEPAPDPLPPGWSVVRSDVYAASGSGRATPPERQ